jgi:phosphatidylglycerophosphatase A
LQWNHPAALIATFGGIGNIPFAPGTCGSLIALPLAWLIRTYADAGTLAAVAAILFVAGWWAAARYIAVARREDPGPVVIDEVAAQMLVLLPATRDVLAYGAGFALFRLFDIVKPWPVSWADRAIKGGFGAMFDDLLAAGYAGGLLYLLMHAMGKL